MIYGCSQPRELWFIDFNHVHVDLVGGSLRCVVFCATNNISLCCDDFRVCKMHERTCT